MIQRIQSIYLLVAGICGIASSCYPLLLHTELTSLQTALPIIGAILGGLAILTIFLFKNRKLQMKIAALGTFLSVGLLGLGFWQINSFDFSNGAEIGLAYYFWAGLPLGFWLATKAIRKDIKLVKSMDSFR